MKNFICLLLIFYTCFSFAQTDNKAKKPELQFKVNTRLQMIYPIQFGNTALAKAHQPRIGFTGQLNVLDFNGFKAGVGFDFVTYEITDKQMIANLSTSKYTSGYFLISYEYRPNQKVCITPNFGRGSSSLYLGSRNSRFGGQSANEFRVGGIIDYKIGKSTYVCGGVSYITSKFDIETAPEYKSFFSKANQLQLSLGIRFGN